MQSSDLEKRQQEIEAFYDDYTDRQKKVGVNARHTSILKKVIAVGLEPQHNVLEIGCGIGTFTSLLIPFIKKGKILSLDISPKSIDLAKEAHTSQHVRFIAADAVDFDFQQQKFDVIILPDVLEHIPIELHAKLFGKLEQLLTKDGFIYIHIPNPFFLEWCHKNTPEVLQLVDQPIHTSILINNIAHTDFFIERLNTYSIWVESGDYQEIVLRKKENLDFSKHVTEKEGILVKMKTRVSSRIKRK
jgi:trans-aconitate 2-methyltransferase